MSITGTAIKVGIISLVLLLFTAIIVVVFGQFRFGSTTPYTAVFSNVSGLEAGQFVRAAGVEVGKISNVELLESGQKVRVDFNVDSDLPLYQETIASVRYLNLIGERYLDLMPCSAAQGDFSCIGSDKRLPAGGVIPIEQTRPALDLDALVGSFQPLFRALDAEKVNNISSAIITIFQGQGGTISDILEQTAQLTSTLAERDQAIGEVIKNLNTVLETTVRHQKEFDDTIKNFETLITSLKNEQDPIADSVANISNAAGTISDLLADNRPLLQSTIGYLDGIQQPLVDQRQQLNDYLAQLPKSIRVIGRGGGIYGDFFNFYACDIALKLNGLQPGGPTRIVKITRQPTGRCTPQ